MYIIINVYSMAIFDILGFALFVAGSRENAHK